MSAKLQANLSGKSAKQVMYLSAMSAKLQANLSGKSVKQQVTYHSAMSAKLQANHSGKSVKKQAMDPTAMSAKLQGNHSGKPVKKQATPCSYTFVASCPLRLKAAHPDYAHWSCQLRVSLQALGRPPRTLR